VPNWILCLIFLLLQALPVYGAELTTLTYHDIVEKKNGDAFAITKNDFIQHMHYLKTQGYQPISLQFLDDVRNGRAVLPEKAVLLTFDDGLKSYYEHAIPILKNYGYPSVLSIVTGWLDGERIPEKYKGKLMTWNQVRTVARSPLVEVISHTHNLHHTIPSNPQGNEAPAGTTRKYDVNTGQYESEEAFRRRIRDDLGRSSRRLTTELNHQVRGIAWPYGQYDQVLIEEAEKLNLKYHFTLDEGPTSLAMLPQINRTTFRKYRALSDLAAALSTKRYRNEQIRFVEVDMDVFGDKSEAEQEILLSALLNRLELLRVNAIIVSPFSSDLKYAYFYNDQIPVRKNILNRVLRRIQTRNGISRIYLKIPRHLPTENWQTVYKDLARLNWFSGIIMTEPAPASEIDVVKALFAYYKPTIQVGSMAEPTEQNNIDFFLVKLDADLARNKLRKQVRDALNKTNNVFFLLNRIPGTTDKQLIRAMQVLRHEGGANFGYDNDNYLENVPDIMKVVIEISGYARIRR
jgi:peptidoglycan/xylan/chitin deacetylase (PgdA/CDA1 family)